MNVTCAGTGEAFDVDLIIYGIALLFAVISFLLFFPSWRRRRLRERREADFEQRYEENVRIAGERPGVTMPGGTQPGEKQSEEDAAAGVPR